MQMKKDVACSADDGAQLHDVESHKKSDALLFLVGLRFYDHLADHPVIRHRLALDNT